jgi:hypothetical protein
MSKYFLLKIAKWQFSLHTIVAARGLLLINANSPKDTPFF